MCVVAGLVLILSLSRSGAVLALLTNIGTVATLLLLKSKIVQDVAREGNGMLTVTFESGWFLALGTAVLCVLINGVMAARGANKQPAISITKRDSRPRQCGSCGSEVSPEAVFCGRCGAKTGRDNAPAPIQG